MINLFRKKVIFYFILFLIVLILILYNNIKIDSISSFYNKNLNKDNFTSNAFEYESTPKRDNWIVITSVNEPTEQIKFLSKIDKFQLLVVGDLKTNLNWTWENVIYLSVEKQKNLKYKSFNTIPFNSYARKNIGYLYAVQHGAKYIYDTDDDNKPIVNLSEYFNFESYDYGLIFDANSPRVLNPYAHFGQPLIWPRGYPLSEIHKTHYNTYVCGKRKVSFVQQGVVNGDPDVDAIFRLVK